MQFSTNYKKQYDLILLINIMLFFIYFKGDVSTGQNIELTDNLELYIIEIPKARKILQKAK